MAPNEEEKPVIVFIPGAWHTASAYESLSSSLRNAGFKVEALDLPSTGGDPEVYKNADADIDLIASSIKRYADEGKRVVVVSHSAGAWFACEAAQGLSLDDRKNKGLEGGIVRLVFIAGCVHDVGVSVLGGAGGHETLAPFLDITGDVDVPKPAMAKAALYGDVPDDVADQMVAQLKASPHAVRFQALSYAAWKYIPSSYLICEDDKAVPPADQEAMVSHPDGKFVHVERCFASHSPWLSQPEFTEAFVRRAAGETL